MVNKSKMTLDKAKQLFSDLKIEMPEPKVHELKPKVEDVTVPGYKTRHHYEGWQVVPRGGLFGGYDKEWVNYW